MKLEHREFEVRAVDPATRKFTGLAVPWDTDTRIGSYYTERVARGAVRDSDDAKVLWRHDEPIGRVIAHRDTAAGWEIDARLSETARGDEAYTLLKDGVVDRLSIGFEPVEHVEEHDDTTGDMTVVRTHIRVREVSLVPFPAYPDAAVTDVRSATLHNLQEPAMTDTMTRADLDEVRTMIEDLDRKVGALPTSPPAAPAADTRSAGEVLKAIVAGDTATIDAYETVKRAYTGGTSADAVVKPGWVGDLTRIFDASSGVLAATFATGTLPETGLSIEFAELASNTIAVAEQAAEGDDLNIGKVAISTRTAPVKTYGGATALTRQEIERSTVGVLNRSLEALAMAAGVRKKLVLRAAYEALVTARRGIAADAGVVSLGATLAAGTVGHWEDTLIDAAIKYDEQALPLETLLVSKTVFKKLRSLTVAGERVFTVAERNASGTLNLPGLTGQLAGIPVRLDTGQAGDSAVFATGRALRQYDSALMSLSDENIINLSKQFSVYRYGAVAAEIPAGVVPVKFS